MLAARTDGERGAGEAAVSGLRNGELRPESGVA